MDANIPFYVIDDDEQLCLTLKTIVGKIFPNSSVFTALGGDDGWNLIKKETRQAIIISDLFMPGLNGLQLLKKIRSEDSTKENYFVLITSASDQDTNLRALQQGADDFILKPFAIDQLIAKLRSATRIIKMQMLQKEENKRLSELNEQLEAEVNKTRELLIKLQENKFPNSNKMLKRVADISVWIAKEMGIVDKKELINIIKSAELALIGRICLPDTLISEPIMVSGHTKNSNVKRVPEFAKELLSYMKNSEDIAKIIFHIFENFDGSGMPEGIIGWKIPLGSRIIRVALDYEEILVKTKQAPGKVLEEIEKQTKRVYDHKIVTLMDQYFAISGIGGSYGKEKPIERKELEEGMMITRNIITESGLKLLAAGTFMNEENIEKVRAITRNDAIIGKIYIRI